MAMVAADGCSTSIRSKNHTKTRFGGFFFAYRKFLMALGAHDVPKNPTRPAKPAVWFFFSFDKTQ